MELAAAITTIERSEQFRGFSEQEREAYLVHAFSMHAPGKGAEWQLGYYLPKREKLVVFKAEPCERLPEDEAFNKGGPIKRLEIAEVQLPPEEAERKAMALKEEQFPAEQVTKVILILQHLDRQLYNLTLVTSTFNIFNVRIDAASGEIISSELRSIMTLGRQEK